jgi:streptomycin 6-kinase
VSNLPDQAALEQIARAVAEEWKLELGPAFAMSRYSFVAPVGETAVLKIIPASDSESTEDADGLLRWNGEGAVRLLRRDATNRVLLMERAVPGTDISLLPDDEATAIAVQLGRLLWVSAGEPFQWIGDRLPGWLDEAEREGREGAELIPIARELLAGIDVGRHTLVHGDFHHYNILRHGDRYVAIDSKAMLGEPEYDVPSFLWNPLGSEGHGDLPLERTLQRLALFEQAGLDAWRMRAWTAIRGAHLGATASEVATIRMLLS